MPRWSPIHLGNQCRLGGPRKWRVCFREASRCRVSPPSHGVLEHVWLGDMGWWSEMEIVNSVILFFFIINLFGLPPFSSLHHILIPFIYLNICSWLFLILPF
ncbi:hypothetical protein F4802DRAFT_113632 [Xylaria palmicola]|nr:hypothetical protein F4802DRAFT_113632 [Xylaria palmicola]